MNHVVITTSLWFKKCYEKEKNCMKIIIRCRNSNNLNNVMWKLKTNMKIINKNDNCLIFKNFLLKNFILEKSCRNNYNGKYNLYRCYIQSCSFIHAELSKFIQICRIMFLNQVSLVSIPVHFQYVIDVQRNSISM